MLAFSLPRWMERLLGVSPAESGEGTQWGYDSTWSLAPWQTLLLAAFVIGFVAFFYYRERGAAGPLYTLLMAALRTATIGVVLFMIAEFVLTRERTGLPYVVVLVDDSASMGVADRYDSQALRQTLEKRVRSVGLDKATRINLAKSLLLENQGELLRSIERRYKLKVYFVSGVARLQTGEMDDLLEKIKNLEATGESTQLGQSLRTALNDLRGTPPSAVVLLSDGVNTQGEPLSEAAAYARRKNVPLLTVALGSEDPVKNLKLSDLLVDEVVFVNDVVYFEFQLAGAGFAGRQVEVTLREKDNPAALARTTVTIADDEKPQKVRIPYRPTKVGEFEYVVEAQQLKEEQNTDDNALPPRLVSVRKEQIKVLLAQAYPNYEFRYLKNMLQRDSTVELKTVLQQADLDFSKIDDSALTVFPVRRDELFQFDCIIFGDVNPAFLGSTVMENIAAFVKEKGGGVVFIAGPRYTPLEYRHTPLAELFPIDLGSAVAPDPGQNTLSEEFAIQPTPLGLTSPHMQLGDSPHETEQIWRRLPGMYWMLEANNLAPAARVLAEHPTRLGAAGQKLPVFIEQYVGGGKVLLHTVDDTRRWRFRVGDVFFHRYWVQTLRYLSRSKLLGKDRSAELTLDRRKYRQGDTMRMRVRFRDDRQAPTSDDGVTVMLEHQGHKSHRIKLHRAATSRGVFEGAFNNIPEGKFHAWIVAPTSPARRTRSISSSNRRPANSNAFKWTRRN